VIAGQVATVYYFFFFIFIIPIVGKIETILATKKILQLNCTISNDLTKIFKIITTSCFYLFICLFFFGGLFLVGNPYLSLIITVVCLSFLIFNFFRLLKQTNLPFFTTAILTSTVGFFFYTMEFGFILLNLFAMVVSIFLLALTFFFSFFNSKMFKFVKISAVFFLVNVFLLGVFLNLAKLCFFNSVSLEQNSILMLLDLQPNAYLPSNVYLVVKNYNFLNIEKNILFILDPD